MSRRGRKLGGVTLRPAQLREILGSWGATPLRDPEDGAWRVGIAARGGPLSLYALLEPEQLLLYLFEDAYVPPARRAESAELLVRLNHADAWGCFDLDFDTGRVRYRLSLEREGLGREVVERRVAHARSRFEDARPPLRAVCAGALSPARAAAEAPTAWPPADLAARARAAAARLEWERVAAWVAVSRSGGVDRGVRSELAAALAEGEPLRVAAWMADLAEAGAELGESLFVRRALAALGSGEVALGVALARVLRADPSALHFARTLGLGELDDPTLSALGSGAETLLVVHVEERWGFRVRAEGIVCAAQLHGLLAAALHTALESPSWEAPDPDLVACWEGEGPPDVQSTALEVWALDRIGPRVLLKRATAPQPLAVQSDLAALAEVEVLGALSFEEIEEIERALAPDA
jgi:hypothetical protein